MDKVLADKSSQSEDSNSLDKSSRSLEVLKQAKSNPFLKKRMLPKNSLKAAWEKHMPAKLEENH